MSLTRAELRKAIQWHREYRPEWDNTPAEYELAGLVGWGKSRRLGTLRSGRVKAYLGVQHVDTEKQGWQIADAPHSKFFASLFTDGRVVTLRTFPTLDDALDLLVAVIW